MYLQVDNRPTLSQIGLSPTIFELFEWTIVSKRTFERQDERFTRRQFFMQLCLIRLSPLPDANYMLMGVALSEEMTGSFVEMVPTTTEKGATCLSIGRRKRTKPRPQSIILPHRRPAAVDHFQLVACKQGAEKTSKELVCMGVCILSIEYGKR